MVESGAVRATDKYIVVEVSPDAFLGRGERFSLEMLALSSYPKPLSPGDAPS